RRRGRAGRARVRLRGSRRQQVTGRNPTLPSGIAGAGPRQKPLAILVPRGLGMAATVDIESVKRRLIEEREGILEERRRLVQDTSRSMEEVVDEDDNDNHMADSASETLDRGIELSLEDNAEHLIAAIDAALGRIEAGTYGRCER